MQESKNSRRIPPVVWIVCGLAVLLGVSLAIFYDECYYPHPLEASLLDLHYRPRVLVAEIDRQFSYWQYGTPSARALVLSDGPQAYLGVDPVVRYIGQVQQVFLWITVAQAPALARWDPGPNQFKWQQTFSSTPLSFGATQDGSTGFAAFQGNSAVTGIDLSNGSTKFTLALPNNSMPRRIVTSFTDDLGVLTNNSFYLSSPPYTSFGSPIPLNYPSPTDALLVGNNWYTAFQQSGHVTVTETNSGSTVRDWLVPGVSKLALSPNGRSVAVGASLGNAGSLTIYDTSTLDKVGTYPLTYPFNSMSFSPAGSKLFLASQAGQNVSVFRMWDKTLEQTTQFGAGPNVMAIF